MHNQLRAMEATAHMWLEKTPVPAWLLWRYAYLTRLIRRLRQRTEQRESALILPPWSPGSLGDEAMLIAIVSRLESQDVRDIGLISYSKRDNWSFLGNVSTPLILARQFANRSWRELFRFVRVAGMFNAFYVIGADVLDGAYSEQHSLIRLTLASLAHATGAETSIIGFSVNSQPTPGVLRAFSRLSPEVHLYTRDPLSNYRLSEHLHRPVGLSADVAFLLEPEHKTVIVKSVEEWVSKEKSAGRVIVGFNASREWLTFTPELSVTDIVQICRDTLVGVTHEHDKVSFVLVSHDIRGPISDYTLAQQIQTALPEDLQPHCNVFPPCGAREIKAICANLDVALSGRMHFAIACLGQGVPVASISYQGKFEGLYQHFGLEEMTISPERALLSGEMLSVFLPVFRDRRPLRRIVEARLPDINELAGKNVAGSHYL
jgi:polysaccharide pyruvyl transferase WcaK-like protein